MIIALATLIPAGREFGYHALTFGMYVDELLQRADSYDRDTATLFTDYIAKPFGEFNSKVKLMTAFLSF